jgi:hypothetical protein
MISNVVVPAITVPIDFSYEPANRASRDWNDQLITLVSASLTKQPSNDGLGLMKSREVYFNVSCCHGTSTQNGTYMGQRRGIGRVNTKEVLTFCHRISKGMYIRTGTRRHLCIHEATRLN